VCSSRITDEFLSTFIKGSAGAGAIIGLRLYPQTMVILLVLFSIYDFVAVYKTRHMVKMAKEMISYGSPLALIIPQDLQGFKKKLKEISPEGKFLVLGGGDIAFPLIFCVSLISQGSFWSFLMSLFSLGGLLLSFILFFIQKKRKPIPALPPITLFLLIGYMIILYLLRKNFF